MTSHEAGGEELSRVLEIGDWAGGCWGLYAVDVAFIETYLKWNSLQV